MQNDKHAVLWALLTVVFWSTASTAFKIALRDLSPIQLLWVASLTSTFVLMLSLIWQNKWSALKAQSTAELFRSLGLGILNPVAYYIVLFEAYSRLPAQMAQPLNYTWPLVLVFLSAIILKQQIHLKSYIALIVSFVGVVIIASKGSFSGFAGVDILGVILASGSALIWASFWLLNLRDKRDESVKLFMSFLAGSLVMTLIVFIHGDIRPMSFVGVGAGVYVGLFEMGFAFVFWQKAMQKATSTDKISNLVFLSPFLALIFIAQILNETILPSTFLGLVFIVGGIVIQKVRKVQI